MTRVLAGHVLMWAGVGIVLFSVLGTVVMGDVYGRLHFSAPAGIGAALIGLAVFVRESFSLIGDKALLVAAVVLVTQPLLSHLTGRAAWLRAGGGPGVPEDAEGPSEAGSTR